MHISKLEIKNRPLFILFIRNIMPFVCNRRKTSAQNKAIDYLCRIIKNDLMQ